MHLFDQLARNTFRYLRRFSQNLPSSCDKQTLATCIEKSSINSLFALINFTLNMKNSHIFVGDAIPLKEPDFTLERISLNFNINIWQRVLYSVFKAAKYQSIGIISQTYVCFCSARSHSTRQCHTLLSNSNGNLQVHSLYNRLGNTVYILSLHCSSSK